MRGPFAVVCRAHSGSRILSEAFVRAGIWMGDVDRGGSWDTRDLRRNAPVRKLLKRIDRYSDLPDAKKKKYQQILDEAVQTIRGSAPEGTTAYGFKHPIMAFCVEPILDFYPAARLVHMVRDGRDVMLSRTGQVSRALQNKHRRDRLMVFGQNDIDTFRGVPFDVANRLYRNELEMAYWVNATMYAMRGRNYGDRYYEFKYEDLCKNPRAALEALFTFLEYPLPAEVIEWAEANVHSNRIAKWAGREEELAAAIETGRPALEALGYL